MQRWRTAFSEMAVFAKVVATGSLSAAARELGLSPAMVSRRLAALEARLGVRLVNRTTRSLHLTDEGASYYESCARVLAEIEQAEAAVSAGQERAPGHAAGRAARLVRQPVRRAARAAVRRPLSRGAARAQPVRPQREPDGGRLRPRGPHRRSSTDSSLAARRLAPNRRVVCASPEYLRAATARPARPRSCRSTTACSRRISAARWDTRGPTASPARCASPAATSATTGRCCANGRSPGLGVALKSTWDVRRHLEDGALVVAASGL